MLAALLHPGELSVELRPAGVVIADQDAAVAIHDAQVLDRLAGTRWRGGIPDQPLIRGPDGDHLRAARQRGIVFAGVADDVDRGFVRAQGLFGAQRSLYRLIEPGSFQPPGEPLVRAGDKPGRDRRAQQRRHQHRGPLHRSARHRPDPPRMTGIPREDPPARSGPGQPSVPAPSPYSLAAHPACAVSTAPAATPAALASARLRRQRLLRRRGGGVSAVHPHAALQLRDPQLQPLDQLSLASLPCLQRHAQRRDLGTLGLHHPPQPGIGRG